MRLLLALFVAVSAHADIIVEVPGCYFFQGQVVSAAKDSLRLKIYPETGSEETIEVALRGKPRLLLPHGHIELVANVEGRGPLDKVKLTAEAGRIASLKPAAINAGRVGLWQGNAKEGKCP